MGAAPTDTGGDANRWDPITLNGTITGDAVSAPTYDGTLTVPVFDTMDPTLLVLELPLKSLTIDMACLAEDRSCVGARSGSQYRTNGGHLSGYITVTDADAGHLDVSLGTVSINTTLCMYIAGMSAMPDTCADYPQSTWAVQPDSMCDATSCQGNTPGTTDVCDPATTCNAWKIVGGFAAQGVEITG